MKVNILEKYLASVESGELPANSDLLRQVKCIVQKLPTAPESSLNETSVGAYMVLIRIRALETQSCKAYFRSDCDRIPGEYYRGLPAIATASTKIGSHSRQETGRATAQTPSNITVNLYVTLSRFTSSRKSR